MPSGHISMAIGSKGPNLTMTTACAAGTHAVGEAYRHIKYGMSDVMISGGYRRSDLSPWGERIYLNEGTFQEKRQSC